MGVNGNTEEQYQSQWAFDFVVGHTYAQVIQRGEDSGEFTWSWVKTGHEKQEDVQVVDQERDACLC